MRQVYNRPDDLSGIADGTPTPLADAITRILANAWDMIATSSETHRPWPRGGLPPCRIMPTRNCPVAYDGVCGDRPCARFESEDEAVWLCNPPTRALIDDVYTRLVQARRDAEDQWLR